MECPRLKWIEKEHVLMVEIKKDPYGSLVFYPCFLINGWLKGTSIPMCHSVDSELSVICQLSNKMKP